MSVVILDEPIKKRIAVVKRYAELHRYSTADMREIIAKNKPSPGDNEEHVIQFQGTGLRVVLTLEEQPIGWMWHVSASIPRENYVPDRPMLQILLKELGINAENLVTVWPEPCGENKVAINLLLLAGELDPSRN